MGKSSGLSSALSLVTLLISIQTSVMRYLTNVSMVRSILENGWNWVGTCRLWVNKINSWIIKYCWKYLHFIIPFIYQIDAIFSFLLGSVAYEKLHSALTNVNLMKGIKQASPLAQTSCLEGFHYVLNHFAPKMIAYSYVGMYCRYGSFFEVDVIKNLVEVWYNSMVDNAEKIIF